MTKVLEGIRVLDVSQYAFVPAAGAVLADWGADVLHIEHPQYGDAGRGMTVAGFGPAGDDKVPLIWAITGRGKRSVALDLSQKEGRELLLKLVEGADVFLTSYLPDVREKLGIDVSDIRGRNPRIIYARGSGLGPRGPERGKGGFDAISFWCRGGIARALTPATDALPTRMPAPGFGDVTTGQMLAGGIAAALFQRERTGDAAVVDVSLLGSALWAMQASITGTSLNGQQNIAWPASYDSPPNPLVNVYVTSDGGQIALNLLQSDRFWANFCIAIGHSELIEDLRFSSSELRAHNSPELVVVLRRIFVEKPLEVWTALLRTQEGQWETAVWPGDLREDTQAQANGYIQPLATGDGRTMSVVVSPVQFDETAAETTPAPEFGDSTEVMLLELGLDWNDILQLKEKNVIP